MTAVLLTLCALWFAAVWIAAVWIAVRDLDREQTARMKAERNLKLQHELDEATGELVIWDEARRFHWALSRWRDYEAWRVRFREAERIYHIRNRRLLWDGVVRIGEDVA